MNVTATCPIHGTIEVQLRSPCNYDYVVVNQLKDTCCKHAMINRLGGLQMTQTNGATTDLEKDIKDIKAEIKKLSNKVQHGETWRIRSEVDPNTVHEIPYQLSSSEKSSLLDKISHLRSALSMLEYQMEVFSKPPVKITDEQFIKAHENIDWTVDLDDIDF